MAETNDSSTARKRKAILFWIWLMMLVAYLDRVNITVAGPTIMKALHIDHAAFGGVLSAFALGYAVMQVPGGMLADRFGAKPVLVAALLIWSAFTALTGAAGSRAALQATRFAFGLGEGIENGGQFKLIGDSFAPAERSSANAIFLTAIALGPAFAAPLTASLIGSIGWRSVFFIFAAAGSIVAILLARFLPRLAPKEIIPTERRDVESVGLRDLLSRNAPWTPFAAYLLFNIAFWGFVGWMPTYLSEARSIKLANLGWIASIPYLCGFAGMLISGRLGSGEPAAHRAPLVAICYLLAGIFLYVAFSAAGATRCVAGLSLAAFFLYGGFGPFWAIALSEIPAEQRGTASGFVTMGGQIGGLIAPIVVGVIVARTGSYAGGFVFMIGALVFAAVAILAQPIRPGFAGSPSRRSGRKG